jgi:hypothetical protein
MSDAPTPAEVVSALSEHPHLNAIVRFVRRIAMDAAERRQQNFASRTPEGRDQSAPSLPEGLTSSDLGTRFGNVAELVGHGVTTPTEALLIGVLLALSAREEAASEQEEETLVAHMTWLAAHTPCDALLALDAAAGEREGLWRALARISYEPVEVAPDFGRTEALLAAATLGSAHSPAAAPPRTRALARVDDPGVRALLALGGLAREPLLGELSPTPFGPLTTAVLALTLVLGALQLARLVARLAFGYRRPASFTLTERGLELTYRVELLGRVVKEETLLVPLANLASVTREVQYPRAGLYAGLAALVIGTYFGMGLFVDALRVPGGSSSLMAMAVALIVAGLALDFVLSSGIDGMRGRCQLLVEPRKGRTICLGAIDATQAEAMLASITAVASGATPGPSLLPPPA